MPITVHYPAPGHSTLDPHSIGLSAQDPILTKAATRHVSWLTTLTCKENAGRTHLRRPAPSSAALASANWSGYIAFASGINIASMEWHVPNAGPPSGASDTYSSIWPGIGGGTNGSTDELIQDGTEQDATCYLQSAATCDGYKDHYYFWFELYPKEYEQEVTNLTTAAGHDVATEAEYASGTAYFIICDYTQNQCVDGSFASPPPKSQAEWIVERPTVNGSYALLAKYGTVTITSADYSTSSSSSMLPITATSNHSSITMETSTHVLSSVGALGSSGDRFTATWHNYS